MEDFSPAASLVMRGETIIDDYCVKLSSCKDSKGNNLLHKAGGSLDRLLWGYFGSSLHGRVGIHLCSHAGQ